MGAPIAPLRAVCDTNVVISALIFGGRLSWLRESWISGTVVPLACAETVRELVRALAYPKFCLGEQDRDELLGDYLPFATLLEADRAKSASARCRDPKDQIFVDLAFAGAADMLVTGDRDLLALRNVVPFQILPPAQAHAIARSGD